MHSGLPFGIAGGLARLPVPRSRSATFRPAHIQEHGVILRFGPHPIPLCVADNGLAAFVDVDVFDGDLLLSLAAMAFQWLEQRRVRAGYPRLFSLPRTGLFPFARQLHFSAFF